MIAREVFERHADCNIPSAQGLGALGELPKGLTWEGYCRARPGVSVMEYLMLTGVQSI